MICFADSYCCYQQVTTLFYFETVLRYFIYIDLCSIIFFFLFSYEPVTYKIINTSVHLFVYKQVKLLTTHVVVIKSILFC